MKNERDLSKIVNVHNDRVGQGALFGIEDGVDCFGIQGVSAKSVNSLGGESDKAS